jgi:hypothetical protein
MATDTETLRSEIQRKVQDYGGEMTGLTSDDIADEIMQLVEEHTRLAVEKALIAQREAIARAIDARRLEALRERGGDYEHGQVYAFGEAEEIAHDFGEDVSDGL